MSTMTRERTILEVLTATSLSPTEARNLLKEVFGVPENDIAPLLGPGAGSGAVLFELVDLPGSFPAKLTVYADSELRAGPKSDHDLAHAIAEKTKSHTLTSLPNEHPQEGNPYAWMRHAPGHEPQLVYERPRDDDGVDLA